MGYVHTSGWRGYQMPLFAVAGANDTGEWSDSPCPTKVCIKELKAVKTILRKEKIPFKSTIGTTSNVFCIHRYIVCAEEDCERARELVKSYLKDNYTRLLYVCP